MIVVEESFNYYEANRIEIGQSEKRFNLLMIIFSYMLKMCKYSLDISVQIRYVCHQCHFDSSLPKIKSIRNEITTKICYDATKILIFGRIFTNNNFNNVKIEIFL